MEKKNEVLLNNVGQVFFLELIFHDFKGAFYRTRKPELKVLIIF